MKSITQAQMEEKQLERLAAQRQLYSKAKKVHVVNMILAVPISIIVLILATLIPEWQNYATFWGIIITILDFALFNRSEDSLRLCAAKIQEIFDCEVLDLPWSEVECGSRPDPEDVTEYSRKYLDQYGDYEEGIKNGWYAVEVQQLPMHLGRLVCQRSNITWESRLRRRYAKGIAVLLTLITTLAVALGFSRSMNLQDFFFFVIAPLMPAYVWGIRQYRLNQEAAANMDRLKEIIDRLWEDALQRRRSPEELKAASRELQDEIYDHRRLTPSVFDRVYKRYRSGDEEKMVEVTKRMIADALALKNEK